MKHNIVKIVLTMGFIILILLYNISWNISREVNGVMIKLDDSSFLEPITVKLEGTYDANCLCKDVYKGYIRISNNDLTDYIVDDQLEINVENGSPITYMYDKSDWQFKENGEAFYHYGYLLSKRGLFKLSFKVAQNRGWMSDSGYCIVTGVESYDKAMRILAQDYGISPPPDS